MKTYIISYNLSNSARNYSDFYDAIKTNMPENRLFRVLAVWVALATAYTVSLARRPDLIST